jgi:hypothetical protein
VDSDPRNALGARNALLLRCSQPSVEKRGDRSFRRRAMAGFQIVFGVLTNASLHQTVLLNLDTDELIAWCAGSKR